jgi:hypothetical protein
MSNEISVKLVMKDGNIDRDATLDAVETALDLEIEMVSKDNEVLTQALATFYSENEGLSANTPAIVSCVLGKVGFTPKSYDRLRERLTTIIHEDKRFYTVKGAGKNAGLNRMSDAEWASFQKDGVNPQQRSLAARKSAKSQ